MAEIFKFVNRCEGLSRTQIIFCVQAVCLFLQMLTIVVNALSRLCEMIKFASRQVVADQKTNEIKSHKPLNNSVDMLKLPKAISMVLLGLSLRAFFPYLRQLQAVM